MRDPYFPDSSSNSCISRSDFQGSTDCAVLSCLVFLSDGLLFFEGPEDAVSSDRFARRSLWSFEVCEGVGCRV